MSAGRITLVRHGQASFGDAVYDRLSPVGIRQARLLGEWWALRADPRPVVVCGSLRRHRETAEACLDGWGISPCEIHEDGGFDEFDHQEVLARHAPDFARPEDLVRFLAEQPDARRAFQRLFADAVARWAGGGNDGEYRESWPGFKARCVQALARAAALRDDGGPVVVFTSGGPIGTAVQHILQVPDSHVFDLYWVLQNASVTRLDNRRGRLTLSSFNGVPHLEAASDAALITYR
ncbi:MULTISPECIES: histidine phosphatase family protein [Alphaproteobacteria]|uniref:Phosphoglycerate kinase n=2 Tax=Alphaproteobacteria TaxID=28211 RepID=A0A512HGX1_9HYPH|nr:MULTISPECIES: histidine phosphatase family protein [Alphaproteobacteria]GEO84703.1 phosphoglycerate kinase [Ciceribacter naphthalenivorans]GLR20676.1 phosphoglycerate kinase [Ciceribacter naphthalenivorans]GLT03532.1 phosphoglycerate kinase [Sphingomonas psychrolutea]